MPTNEELIQQQGLRDKARIAKRKQIQAQMNSPKQQLLFGKMGLNFRIKPSEEEEVTAQE